MSLVLPIDYVEPASPLFLVPEFLGPLEVGHGRLLGVADGGINNRFYFIFSGEHPLLSGLDGDRVRAWSAPLRLPHMQDVDYRLRLLVNCRRSALLVG